MSEEILDGAGSGMLAKVDIKNRLAVLSTGKTNIQAANTFGDAYNINTGDISVSATSAILYYSHDDAQPFIVDNIALGLKQGSVTNTPVMTIIRNPTGGTIISNAVDVDMNENRNFGSSTSLSSELIFKGVSGDTITGGTEIAQFYQTANGRLFASVDFELIRGSSICIRLDPDLSSGTIVTYAALVGHLKLIE
jgi:hypothetical protein